MTLRLAALLILLALPSLAQGQATITTDNSQETLLLPNETATDHWFVQAEFLTWWLRKQRVPPLLTAGPLSATGALGEPGVGMVYGDKLESRHVRFIGSRFTIGYWLDDEHDWSIEVTGLFLERDSTNFTIKRTPEGVLFAQPFINAETGLPDAQIIAGPSPAGNLTGSFNAYSRVEFFGEEVNSVQNLSRCDSWRLDWLCGLHCLQLRERVDITSTSRVLPAETTLLANSDHFSAFNKFYGGQIGLRGEVRNGMWFANCQGKVAIGATDTILRTKGDRTFQTPTVKAVQPFGLYVQPSNSGEFTDVRFDAVYEIGLNCGCEPSEWCRLFAGYSLIYWTNPVHPGDQIDAISPGAPSPRPTIPFRDDFFWAHGVNVGLELRW